MIRLTTFGIVGALALCLVGCSTPPGAFIILQNQVANDDCSIPATLGAVYRGEGLLDVRVPNAAYVLFPLLQNDFPPPPGGGQTVDGNRIALAGFDIQVGLPSNFEPGPVADLINNLNSLSADDSMKTLVQYSTLTSGTVSSGGGNTASSVVVFPSDLSNMIRATGGLSATKTYWVEASVRARGNTVWGAVHSDTFHYPIQLCDGCLTQDLGQCAGGSSGSTSCTPGQDGVVGCCTQAGSLVCQ